MKFKFLIFLAVCFLALYGIYYYFSPKPQTQNAQHSHFNPELVKQVDWSFAKTPLSFSRTSVKVDWQPLVEPNVMQEKLNALANVELSPKGLLENGLKIEITFSPNDKWVGRYHDRLFVWVLGPLSGQGFVADSHLAKVFEEGEWAFSSRYWQWCDERPKRISSAHQGEKFSVFQDKGRWFIDVNNETVEIDATSVEKWLGENCRLKTRYYLDLKEYSLNKFSSKSIHIEFMSGKKVSWDLKGDYWKVGKHLAIMSDQLDAAINQLYLFRRTP